MTTALLWWTEPNYFLQWQQIPIKQHNHIETKYQIAGNICGNLIWTLRLRPKIAILYSTQYYFNAMWVGVRHNKKGATAMCRRAQKRNEGWLFSFHTAVHRHRLHYHKQRLHRHVYGLRMCGSIRHPLLLYVGVHGTARSQNAKFNSANK